MFRLTREVRFAVNPPILPVGGEPAAFAHAAAEDGRRSSNSYAGIPPALGLAAWSALRVTISGPLNAERQYLCDIKEIDAAVRGIAVPIISRATLAAWKMPSGLGPAAVLREVWLALENAWPGAVLASLSWALTPLTSVEFQRTNTEQPMLRMSEKFEFSASHRLYDPKLGDEQNQRIYGRCSNPLGHGHNYELQVTLALGAESAEQSGAGKIIPALESIVAKHVIERFDHRNLNLEIEEFKTKIPSVENIAAVIYGLLKPAIAQLPGARLAAVTVWETPKTWCEYSE
jgi:6-pyruvoyltetrahydropterin/6-carboxytetrahydropterin synthase